MSGLDAFNEYKQEFQSAQLAFNNIYAYKHIIYGKGKKYLSIMICGKPNQIYDFETYQLNTNTMNLNSISNWLIFRQMTGRCEINKRCLSVKLYLWARSFNKRMKKNNLLLDPDCLFLSSFMNSTEDVINTHNLTYNEVKDLLEAIQTLLLENKEDEKDA